MENVRHDLTESLMKLEQARTLIAAKGDPEMIERASGIMNWIESKVHELVSLTEPPRFGH